MLHAQHSSRCSWRHHRLAIGAVLCFLGCSSPEAPEAPFRQDGTASRPAFCDRPEVRKRKTAIDVAFCGEHGAPAITSVRDVQALLELVPFDRTSDAEGLKHTNEVVMLGLSTALPGRFVSPINPRAIILGRENIMAYVRGAQEVELASRTRDGSDRYVFYLLRYQQDCNGSEAGCNFGELYTPATESSWTATQLHDDTELENTPFDCRACHARASEQTSLLMREVDGPWTHFFDTLHNEGSVRPERTGYDLLQDYLAAKGGELYAQIDATRMTPSTAQALEISVGLEQPLYFDSLVIERERWPSHDGGFASEAETSPTWEAAYAAFKRGEQLALPHFDPRPTSPEKQARLSDAYTRFRNGELDAAELPDLADIFPDEPLTRAQIGLEVEPEASAVETLIQACGPCHNNALNPKISRAAFSIDLARMDQDEIDAAIERLELPPTAAGAMPPQRARALTPSLRARLLDYLRGQTDAEPQLTQAAESAMLGGSRPRR